jgi:hypothetical protein
VDAQRTLKDSGLEHFITGQGDLILDQFPIPGEVVNLGERVILRVK